MLRNGRNRSEKENLRGRKRKRERERARERERETSNTIFIMFYKTNCSIKSFIPFYYSISTEYIKPI